MLASLTDRTLVGTSSYVDGQWLESTNNFAVINPATNKTIIKVSAANESDAQHAVEKAKLAFPLWAMLTANQRAEYLMRWFELIHLHIDDLSYLLTLEQGKPLAQAKSEIVYGASYLQWFAEQGKRINGDAMQMPDNASQQMLLLKQPVGVVSAITPWNFPHAMIARKAAAALAAGCTFIVKPASQTPLSALAMAELSARAGIPQGVFNVIVSENAKGIGQVLTQHPDIAKVSFTGSTKTGKTLLKQCASSIKRVSMELGGNAPFIVCADANIDDAVAGAMASKFRNSGQTCIASNRFFIDTKVIDKFTQVLMSAIKGLSVGNGLATSCDIGPLIDQRAVLQTQQKIAQAVEQGAKIHYQATLSHEHAAINNFFPPTILTHVDNTMAIAQQEIFAPVVVLISFESEQALLAMANDTDYGLAAYLYSENIKTCMRLSRGLDYAMIGVNEGIISNAAAPFGGIKHSGMGREGGLNGLDDFLTLKYLCVGC